MGKCDWRKIRAARTNSWNGQFVDEVSREFARALLDLHERVKALEKSAIKVGDEVWSEVEDGNYMRETYFEFYREPSDERDTTDADGT